MGSENVKVVKRVKYLGEILSKDRKCEVEIKQRIYLAKLNFQKLKSVFKNNRINLKTKDRLL